MVSNKKALLILTTMLLSSFVNFAQTSFAETVVVDSDPTACSGEIKGVTESFNANGGVTSFDAHPDANGVSGSADVSIVTGSHSPAGIAPARRGDAACISKTANSAYGQPYEYALKGWAWNTNGGFVSFNCKAGMNNAGGGDVACGSYDYGVYISGDKGGGVRNLFGYAWNPTFGYIQFQNNPADTIKYGVKIDASGKTSGYAWTSAGIYLDFNGVTLNLPDQTVVETPTDWCAGKKYLCMEITPDPATLSFDATGMSVGTTANGVAIADGKDGYDLNLYFRNEDGVGIEPTLITNLIQINFSDWTDTVKLDQVDPTNISATAVQHKPTSWSDFTQAYLANGQKDVGHYVTKKKIVSYAPTSESKLSMTTGTKPAYFVNNENFIYTPDGVGDLPKAGNNQLILNSVSLDADLVDGTGKVLVPKTSAPIFPNGKVGLTFKFRPAIYLDTLYANNKQDSILGYRSVPVTLKRGLKEIGDLGNVTGSVESHVAYSSSQTAAKCTGQDSNFQFTVSNDGAGGDMGSTNSSGDVKIINDITSFIGKIFDLQFTPDIQAGVLPPCDVAKGATFYSVINYITADGKHVLYYDNKLPRVGGDSIANPAAVIHGNIFAQAVGSVQGDQRVQTSGSVNINLIRDAINENLQKNTDQKTLATRVAVDCTITSMGENGVMGLGVGACPSGQNSYLRFDVGSEHVLYSKANVTLAFSSGTWTGNWVVISDGGNIFVDNNLYPTDATNSKISLIALRAANADKYYGTGNIYIKPSVTNLVGTFVADGSIFSYDGTHTDVDAASGEPKWGSAGGDYSAMTSALNSQLLIQGALYSDNTIGGANLDQTANPKSYLLAGGGRVITLPASLTDRMRAQYYDLNYLRMFKLELQVDKDTGLPIDQRCGKAWSPDDQANLSILQGGGTLENGVTAICGSKIPCSSTAGLNQNAACDGINPLSRYDAQAHAYGGDLVVPDNIVRAQGVGEKDFEPVYVYYVAPDKNSFVFSKEGAVNISGK